jgi:hypothetical protein
MDAPGVSNEGAMMDHGVNDFMLVGGHILEMGDGGVDTGEVTGDFRVWVPAIWEADMEVDESVSGVRLLDDGEVFFDLHTEALAL